MRRKNHVQAAIVLALALVLGACSGGPATIVGSVQPLPLSPNPQIVYGVVVLDTDSDFDAAVPSSYVQLYPFSMTNTEISNGQSLSFVFPDVAEGEYCVYATLNLSGAKTYLLDYSGDYEWGYFGNDYSDLSFVPGSANVQVGKTGYVNCDFWIEHKMIAF